MSSAFLRVLRILLQSCFGLLCLRFLAASFQDYIENPWPTLVITVIGFLLGAWQPTSALFAFTISVPLQIGLSRSSFLDCVSPPSILFCAIWLGSVFNGTRFLVRERFCQHRINLGENLNLGLSETLAANPISTQKKFPIVADFLAGVVLLSLVVQIWDNRFAPEFWQVFKTRAVLGFADPFYFLTSAFLWLQGLTYFQMILAVRQKPTVTRLEGKKREPELISLWIPAVFASYGAVLVIGFAFQSIFHVPETPRNYIPFVPETSLPYEDSHAFGSVAVAIFVYFSVSWPKFLRSQILLKGIAIAVLLVLIVASWSRAAWMTAILALLFIIYRRLPRWWSFGVIAATACAILVCYHYWRNASAGNPFLYRLGNLVRIDQPRANLYHKAFAMLRDRPMAGFGIGSGNRASVHFAEPGDSLGSVPDFAHNFLLQIATEQGLFVAAVYSGFIGYALFRGFTSAKVVNRSALDERPLLQGAAAALAAYLVTQLTANSLNVYISNQFFFWFLMASMMATHREKIGLAGDWGPSSPGTLRPPLPDNS